MKATKQGIFTALMVSPARAVLLVLAAALVLGSNAVLRAQPQLTEAQLLALRPASPSLVPSCGTFWSVSRPDYPPYPFDPYPDLPVYQLPDGSWLVDDSTIQLAPPGQTVDAPAAARSLLTQRSLVSRQRLASPLLNEASIPGIPDLTNSPPQDNPDPPQLLPPGSAPTNGTFWMLAETNWPPFPYNPCPECDVYALSDGSYLVDDTSFSWPEPSGDGGGTQGQSQPKDATGDLWLEITGVSNSLANVILHSTVPGTLYTITSRQTWSPTEPWDAEQPLIGAEGQDWTPASIPTFGRRVLFLWAHVGPDTPQRLWLYALGISNNCFNLILHGTAEGMTYDLRSTTSLGATNNWAIEMNFVGTSGQFWTPVSIPLSGRPSLFLSARSWADNDGNGLPDWWEQFYFGTNGLDPYALCPSGDGWTILQAWQNGWNPTNFYTPPPPKNVAARLDSTGTNVILTWQSGGGPVTNYAIWDGEYWVGQVDPNIFSFTYHGDLLPGGCVPNWIFTVRAYFTNGASADSLPAPVFASELSSSMAAVRSPGGQLYLAVGSVPPALSSVRVYWLVWDDAVGGYVYRSIDVTATAFVNGVAPLPVDQMPGYAVGGWFDAQCIGTNGNRGAAESLWPYPSSNGDAENGWSGTFPWGFADARLHLKQNLKFLLQSATITQPFSYAPGDAFFSDPTVVWFPESYFARPPGSANYEYSGFHVFSSNLNYSVMRELRPVQENFLWRNFAYDPGDFDSAGSWNNGVDYSSSRPGLRWLSYPNHQFTGTNLDSLPLALSVTNHPYLFARSILYDSLNQFSSDLAEIGVAVAGTDLTNSTLDLPSGVRNVYGLPLNSVWFGYNPPAYHVLDAGGASAPGRDGAYYFCGAEAAALQTVDYYFATQTPYLAAGPYTNGQYYGSAPPLPGSPTFSITNTSPPLITGLGQLMTVSGWAKQAIANGYSGKYAYLEQYFDKAYTIDANGLVTTNSAGLLSHYGEFFPMQPGPSALVTMPDLDTGQPGTGVVHVIKLQLDVNHDGAMNLSFGGPDNTSQARPFVFWLNNNYDRFATDADDGVQYDDDVSSTSADAKSLYTGKSTPDYNYTDAAGNRIISCSRDLQDFARLWVCGVTSNLLTALPPGSTVTLSWGDVGNPNPANPTIDLFKAADPDGGIGYLTNSLTASLQTLSLTSPYIGRLGPGQSIQLNASRFTNNWAGNYLIWCGVTNGTGQLALTISQGGTNTLAQISAYIQLVDIKQMYERWTIGDFPNIPAYTNAIAAPDGLLTGISKFEYGASTDTNTPYILFVHGWNMEPWEKDRFAESAFKRLYWQGYQGRFGSFRWPTENGFKGISTMATNPSEKDNFDRSEYTAWRSGAALLNKLNDLNRQYPGHVYLLAHSMGNIVAGEALRLAGANQVVNTYVASQAAVSAHTYDTNIPNYSFYFSPWVYQCKTPNIYGNWFQGNYGGGAGTVVNFYNTNDFALQRSVWQLNQLFKPDQFVLMGGTHWDYSYNGMTNDPPPWNHFDKAVSLGFTIVDFDIVNILTNRYEVMALAAESWTTAFGATPGVQNVRRSVALPQLWPPDLTHPTHPFDEHFYHSAEFRGDYWQQQGYWRELLGSDAFKLK